MSMATTLCSSRHHVSQAITADACTKRLLAPPTAGVRAHDMAAWVKECKHGVSCDVPGTLFLDQNRFVKVCEDPNDPQNWPRWKKNVTFGMLCVASGVTTALGPMVTTAYGKVSHDFHFSINTSTLILAGTFSIAVGVTTFFTTAAALVYGRRPVYLFSTLLLVPACLWTWRCGTITELVLSRILQGICCAPYETLIAATVVDLYHVDRRATQLSYWGISTGIGLALSQVGGAYVVEKAGWRSLFLIAGLACGFVFLLIALLVPETGYKKQSNFWLVAARPLQLFAAPAVIYGAVVNGLNFAWLIGFALASVVIFERGYHLSPIGVGLTALAAVGGFCVSQPIAGVVTDRIMLDRLSKERYEPEYRLWGMAVASLLATIGFIGFGYSVGHPLWQVLLFFAIAAASLPWTNSAALTYVTDSHEQHTNEAFVALGLAKSLLLLIISGSFNAAIDRFGIVAVMWTVALLNLIVNVSTIPVYIFGKRWRCRFRRSPK